MSVACGRLCSIISINAAEPNEVKDPQQVFAFPHAHKKARRQRDGSDPAAVSLHFGSAANLLNLL